MNVDEMLSGLTARQLHEWSLYDRKHPIGELRTEIEFARLRYLICAVAGNKPENISDFMWSWRREKTVGEMEREVLREFGIG